MADLIKMVRHKEGFAAPYDANVHPDEVDNYARAGWVVVENKPASTPRKRATTRKPAARKRKTATKKT